MNVRRPWQYPLLLAAAIAANSTTAAAQSETPEEVALRYVTAMQTSNWMEVSELMHPDALHELRELFTLLFEVPEASELVGQLLGVSSVTEAQAMSDTALFAGFIEFVVTQDANVADALRTARIEVLGHVPEGTTDAHVVFRTEMTVRGVDMTQMDVISVRRSGDTWRSLLKGDMSAIAAAIRQSLQTKP